MRTDILGNVIYNENDLLELVYQDRKDLLEQVLVEANVKSKIKLRTVDESIYDLDKSMVDAICQEDWFMPEEYKNMDIEAYIYNKVAPWDDVNYRITAELEEFKKRNMLNLLKWLKYFVDTARANNIVWGVGRGSSVASYVLYLLGVHKIDSIKYNLDWQEFLR